MGFTESVVLTNQRSLTYSPPQNKIHVRINLMTTKTTKRIATRINWLRIFLILLGLILTFGWAIIFASFDQLVNLSDTLRAHVGDQSTYLADIIIRVPLIIGSLLIPLGIVYDKKIDITYKLLIILTSAVILYYLTFYFLIFLGILIHGLGPR